MHNPLRNEAGARCCMPSRMASSARSSQPAFLVPARIGLWLLLLAMGSEAVAQDWSVSVTGQPPAYAPVGGFIGVTAQISVDAGADDLTVNNVSSGAMTSGLSAFAVSSQPTSVVAGTSANVMITMLVVAPPGSAGVHLEVEVDGTYGPVGGVRSATSNAISVLEGVAATLAGGAAQVRRGDQIAFDLALVGNSDTDAQLAVPDAGYAVPAGTTLVTRTHGVSTLAAGAATNYGLVVAVSNSDEDGTVIAMTPTGVTYGMSQIGLASRAVPIVPASVSSIVVVPIFADGFE